MKRYAGVLLPVTSLPSKYGIGCFDQAAYDFVDWLQKAGQRYWQILPLGATSYGSSDDSPYQAYSAFAGNPYLISLDALVEEGVLTREECDGVSFGDNPAKVDFDKLHEHRFALLRKAYERSGISANPDYQNFIRDNGWWLNGYALFMALKTFFHDQPFRAWPEDIRMHWGFALEHYNRELYFDIEFQKYMQFKFNQQWSRLKAYANGKHIQIVGDIPIYVSPDGADVWAHPELFQLDAHNAPTAIAGCPPDAFAEDGQAWGNPLYNWNFHRATDYAWWVSRMWYSFKLYDVVRIDHFRGFDEYFSIPADAKTARGGHWEKGPGMELFNSICRHLGNVSVIAEDLGLMTDGVRALVRDSGYPNMKVLQFAVDPADEQHRSPALLPGHRQRLLHVAEQAEHHGVVGCFRRQATDIPLPHRETGVMACPIILQKAAEVLPGDTPEVLQRRRRTIHGGDVAAVGQQRHGQTAQPAPGVAHMGLLRQIGGDAPGQGRIVAAAGHGILQKGHALRCPSLHHPPHLPCFFQHSKSAAGLQDRPAACGRIPP